LDRIPIEIVPKASVTFEHVYVDIIGKINPPSSKNHVYILCLINSATRWVEAVALKTVTAKESCDALLNIFTRTGIPRYVSSDRRSNWLADLSQELCRRLGIKIITSTAAHHSGIGLIERFNGTVQNMLHHVVTSDAPRSWHTALPFLLWAYRTSVNTTTNMTPYELVYGSAGRGPLAVLKDTWSNSTTLDVPMKKSTEEYFKNLKFNLDLCRSLADENASKNQEAYTKQYNKIAKMKTFKVGDSVLFLQPDSTNKLLAQWEGPGRVLECISPHSYRVSLPSGAVRVNHANNLRLFVERVSAVGVIFEDDTDFGPIITYPVSSQNFGNTDITSSDLRNVY